MDESQARLRAAVEIVDVAQQAGAGVRLLGGIAAALHSTNITGGEPHRQFGDIDSVTSRRDVGGLTKALRSIGYQGDSRFNALNAGHRLVFYGPAGKLDVFVNTFEMCHRLDLSRRLSLDSPTLPVSDLLLTKLQVVELTAKDVADANLLFQAHDVSDEEGDVVNSRHIATVLSRDWGLWRTVTSNLEHLASTNEEIRVKVRAVQASIETAAKSSAFRLRAVIGERKRWYDLPEEVGG